ncbi:xylulokinase [Marinihelvus fidelis]|uniref:Xylulose kinase n=1 Tax=Marinihelvus fidelis TaxID=2613842 RepID=A0A5N0TH67_9GAMM|nr:xylulokinase [Marinihelvus fidelis]KAA9132629.1 xylulokinase [Marinihelvus fidelis]
MNTVLGIDLGTQSLKVVFYDDHAREIVASASAPLDVDRDSAGKAEQRAEDWLQALETALRQVPGPIRDSARAIGISGQQHGFVPVDAEGNVLAPVKLWCDTATQAQVDAITADAGGRERCIEWTGLPVLAGYTAPKIRWLADNHPDLYVRMAHVMLPHDYLNYVLSGAIVMEYGDASGTGLLDVRERCWSERMVTTVDPGGRLASALPELVAADTMIGRVTAAAAERFGLPEGTPLSTGGGDNMMAAIGTGNVSAGKLTMSLGTSGTLFAHSDTAVVDEAGNIAAFCGSTGGWMPLLCTMNCTLATELVKQLLDIGNDQFDDTVSGAPAGADGLTVLPFFTGERTPDLPRASASVLGLNAQNTTRAHLLRATMEGATFAIRFGVDELSRLGIQAQEIVLTGGGANSAEWRQAVADICGLPVTVLLQDEGASFGAALQALWMLERSEGRDSDIADIAAAHLQRCPERSVAPNPGTADAYAAAWTRYRKALDTLAPLLDT